MMIPDLYRGYRAWDRLAPRQCDAFCICGTASDDFMAMSRLNLSFFEKHLPSVKVVAIQDGVHDSAFRKPDEVARLPREFLSAGLRSRQPKAV
jgi:hypothetical protein